MITITNLATNEKAATFDNDEWTWFDEELQVRVETMMIEGYPILGGEPYEGVEDTDEGEAVVIGESVKWLSPGEQEFEDNFWDYALDGRYAFEGEDDDASSDVTEATS